jgi:uncharacterized integral membrane protein
MTDTQTRTTRIKAAVVAVLVMLAVIVTVQNTGAVQTKVLFGTFSMPLALLLGLTLISGALAGAALSRRLSHGKSRD